MKIKPKAKQPEAVNIGTNRTNPTDEFFKKRELALRLKVSVRSIENWQRNNLLPFIKVNNVVRFYWPDVMERLQANYRVNARGVPSPKPGITKL